MAKNAKGTPTNLHEHDPGGHGRDRGAAALAARQHGNLSRAQAHALGLGDDAIRWRVRTGRWYPVHAGVYAIGRRPVLWLERAAAAVLAGGRFAVLSHHSALVLWGLAREGEPCHLTATAGRPQPRGVTVHRCGVHRVDITTQRGIRTTSPARTLLDCAAALNPAGVARAVNDARLAHLVTLEALRAVLARYPRHRGSAALAAHVEANGQPSHSGWEDAFPAFCTAHGLPHPTMNALVCGFTVDALFAAERVIVELDSWSYHRDRAAFERDRRRDAVTAAAGLVTVRLTWARMHGEPEVEAARFTPRLQRAGQDEARGRRGGRRGGSVDGVRGCR